VSGKGLGIGKISIFPILVVILFVTSYQEAYGITYGSTLGETGVPGLGNDHFNALIGVAIDSSGKIYVSDEDSHRIQVFDSSTATLASMTIGEPGVAGSDNLHFRFPAGVAVDSAGRIYVSDTDNHRIQVFGSTGGYLSTIGEPNVSGSDSAHLNFPAGIAVNSAGKIYVVDSLNHRVQVFDSYLATLATTTIDISSIPNEEQSGIAVDTAGNIYVSDTNNHRVEKFNSSGAPLLTIGEPGVIGCDSLHFNLPAGIAVDTTGNIYVVDSSNQRIQIFDFMGVYQSTIGKSGVSGPGTSQFNFPFGIAVDSLGKIVVGDSFNFRVQIFDSTGGLETLGTLTCPALSRSSGDPLPSKIKPSFGGVGNMVFADGLTLDGKVYDLSKFAQDIPKTIADVGQPVKIKIKEQLAHGPTDWKYVAVYMNFEGKDPETYNAHLVMSIDKNDGQKIVDPKGYIKDYSVTTELDSKYVYTTFSFIAAKAMPDSTMIVSAWDSRARTNSVHVGGAIQFGQDPPVQPEFPTSVIKFTDYYALKERLGSDGFYGPKILAHIHGTSDVTPDGDSVKVYWLYDTNAHQLTLVVADKDGKRLAEQTQKLDKIVYSHIGYCNLPVFQDSCTSTPVYVDTPEGKALKEKYQGKYTELLKSMGFTPPHY
jgi:sugar lactone lactonase YvrE